MSCSNVCSFRRGLEVQLVIQIKIHFKLFFFKLERAYFIPNLLNRTDWVSPALGKNDLALPVKQMNKAKRPCVPAAAGAPRHPGAAAGTRGHPLRTPTTPLLEHQPLTNSTTSCSVMRTHQLPYSQHAEPSFLSLRL